MKPWKQIDETASVYDGWRKVFRKTFVMNSGKKFVAEIAEQDDSKAVAVIALTKDNQVVIARQFRVGPMLVMDQLPSGMVEPGEDPDETIVRELREETGYEVGTIKRIGEMFKSSYMATKWYYYLAEDCYLGSAGTSFDEWEEIEVDTISISQLFDNAKSGTFTDVEAVFFAYEQLKKREGN